MFKNAVFLAVLSAILLLGCKKDEVIEEPKPTGFIEFKIDGKKYKIEENSSAVAYDEITNASYVVVFGITELGKSVTMIQSSNRTLTVGKYTYDMFNSAQVPSFVFVINAGANVYNFNPIFDTGEIEFTRLDRHAGGKVEGKFHFTNVEYKDKDQNLISTGHKLTDGIFSIVVK